MGEKLSLRPSHRERKVRNTLNLNSDLSNSGLRTQPRDSSAPKADPVRNSRPQMRAKLSISDLSTDIRLLEESSRQEYRRFVLLMVPVFLAALYVFFINSGIYGELLKWLMNFF
jgi:hypothetical protein